MVRHFISLCVLTILSSLYFDSVCANETTSRKEELEQRLAKYVQFQNEVIPWYYLGAIDQYERNIQAARTDIPKREGAIAIQFSKEFWAGAFNPQKEDTWPFTIKYFGGLGQDGNGDGKADPNDIEDIMTTLVTYLSRYGPNEEDYKIALYEYYQSEKAVNQIVTIAKMFKHFNTNNLDTHVFPVPVRGYNYSYRGTWGANRGWGGRRIHEGTDVFAGYSTPVLSTSYGVIEVMGWNEFGGWRVGIRDNHNTYHYFAHLAYFNKKLEVGDIIKPGTVLGGVGSSGYGKEGTSGKFPPHLHYGMYKFNGRTEWAFDPYPSLVQWEKYSKRQSRSKNK